ncbi:serine hydrolase domain-containing protein [Tengunoibacter tsumagoiensis]|uniref:Serine hydrolase n=1 Tax=Tengunoibacter tsumagoiensis TaxID=2014871 RepID=A0A401ZWM0_9CHLR|nr:serine hydrolase domain-containing protein [Tengunoibacter tsumagoiensis]GCE11309.1 serine hydrolase [Tengunoibacter tsumagoiensis]
MQRKICFHPCFIIMTLVCILALTGCMDGGNNQAAKSTPTISTDSISKMKSTLRNEGRSEQFTGAVLIVQNGKILLREGYGKADWGQDISNKPETRFRISTLSEQFNALGLLLLQDQGKLSLTDQICKYIADCPANWQSIIIEQLILHTSEIPDYVSRGTYSDIKARTITPEQLIALFKDQPLTEAYKGRPVFSASNQILEGYIMEKVSGQSYGDYLQSAIFGPLHLTHTSYVKNNEPLPDYATGYSQPRVVSDPIDASVLYASGGIYSTVDDLYTFDQALIQHKIGTQALWKNLFTTKYAYCGAESSCGGRYVEAGLGYGWFIGKERGDNGSEREVYFNDGDYEGFSSANIYYPDQKVSVIILSNATTDPIQVYDEEGLIENSLFPTS